MAHKIKMPQLGLTMEEGTIEKWLKRVGDPVKKGEAVLEISTDKLTNEIESEFDGVLLSIIAQEGQDVKVKGLLGYIGEKGELVGSVPATAEPEVEAAVPVAAAAAPAAAVTASGRIKASPLAKKTAEKLGVDISAITGHGPGGRILQRDVLDAKENGVAAAVVTSAIPVSAATTVTTGEALPVKNLELMEGDTVAKISPMRRVVANRMFASASEIPTVTQTVKVDVTALMAFRRKVNEKRETKLSVNDFVLKAVAKALRQSPAILVSLDGDRIIQRAHVNLGMAVALESGLIVPVIRDADQLSLEALSAKAKDLASRARENKLSADEYKGSTFSVSNLGMFGVESFTPIINQPDAAILGVNSISDELVMEENGSITKHQVMRISMTYDHRLMDGSAAAVFEAKVRELLENPLEIIL